MDKQNLLIAGLFTLLFLGIGGLHAFCQSESGKCSNTLLAMNMAPLKTVKKSAIVKPDCKQKEKRVNERPQKAATESIGLYHNITMDQLEDTFISIYPGLISDSDPDPKKPCPPKSGKKEEQLTACQKKLEIKPCIIKGQDIKPKKLRPSAMVKLASYTPR